MDINEGVYDGISPRFWEVEVYTPDEASEQKKAQKAEASLASDMARLLDAARQHPSGETLRTLRGHAKINNGTRAQAARDALVSKGDLKVGTITKHGQQYEALVPTILA